MPTYQKTNGSNRFCSWLETNFSGIDLNKLRIIVFGLGRGEAILCELENNEWMAIDCFLEPDTKEPVAIYYLKKLGINPKEKLTKVLLTHFHEDHILGGKELIASASPQVKVYIPQAMTLYEMKKFFGEQRLYSGYQADNKLESFMEILDLLFAEQKKTIHVKQDSVVYGGSKMSTYALSPSEHDSQASLQKFLALIAKTTDKSQLKVSKHAPNSFSISLHVHYHCINKSALLAGDLEICKSVDGGWLSAMNSECSPKHIDIMKVSHHGSKTGYDVNTWDHHITPSTQAVMTTYDSSDLPQEDMVNIMKDHTNNLYCATKPKYLKRKLAEQSKNDNYKALKRKYGASQAKKMIELGLDRKITNVEEHKFGYLEVEIDLNSADITINKYLEATSI